MISLRFLVSFANKVLVAEVSRVLLSAYPHTSITSTPLWCDLRNPLQAHLEYYGKSVPMQRLLPV